MDEPKNVGAKRKYNTLQDESGWSNKDKLLLLKALKKYEHTDIESISKMLPNKNCVTIKEMIDELITKSNTMENRVPIIDWLQSGLFKKNDSLVPLALHFIELFEKHSSPDSEKCNYSSIYNFLYCLSAGRTVPDLEPETKRVLYSTLNSVMEGVWPNSQDEVLNYIAKLGKKQNNRKVYRGKEKSILQDDNNDSHHSKLAKNDTTNEHFIL